MERLSLLTKKGGKCSIKEIPKSSTVFLHGFIEYIYRIHPYTIHLGIAPFLETLS